VTEYVGCAGSLDLAKGASWALWSREADLRGEHLSDTLICHRFAAEVELCCSDKHLPGKRPRVFDVTALPTDKELPVLPSLHGFGTSIACHSKPVSACPGGPSQVRVAGLCDAVYLPGRPGSEEPGWNVWRE
jgi:hypothetical protein